MKLKTSLNKEYEISFADIATMTTGQLMVQLKDSRRIHEIASDFDNLEWMERESKNQGNVRFEGWSQLVTIRKNKDGTVLLAFESEVTPNA